jgi:hypothetical protein
VCFLPDPYRPPIANTYIRLIELDPDAWSNGNTNMVKTHGFSWCRSKICSVRR